MGCVGSQGWTQVQAAQQGLAPRVTTTPPHAPERSADCRTGGRPVAKKAVKTRLVPGLQQAHGRRAQATR